MAFHQKILLLSIGLLSAALLAAAALLLLGAARIPHTEKTRQKLLLYHDSAVQLAPGVKVVQEFTAFYPGLSQLEVLLAGSPTATQPVDLHLRDTCHATDDIFTGSLLIPAQAAPQFYAVSLPQPLDDSAGQSYCLVLESVQAGIALPLSDGDLYPYGQLNIYEPSPQPSPSPAATPAADAGAAMPYKVYLPLVVRSDAGKRNADIGFLLHYDGLPGPTLQTFAARLTANKPFVWGSVGFYAGLLLVYLALLAGLAVVARWSMRLG